MTTTPLAERLARIRERHAQPVVDVTEPRHQPPAGQAQTDAGAQALLEDHLGARVVETRPHVR